MPLYKRPMSHLRMIMSRNFIARQNRCMQLWQIAWTNMLSAPLFAFHHCSSQTGFTNRQFVVILFSVFEFVDW